MASNERRVANPGVLYASEHGVSGRRPDIQGLRAIAVIFVVVFHAGLPFPGGFVGVDVFFVISGFVITAMLFREVTSSGRVNFKLFYYRRFTRLTPALALTVTGTVLISAVVMSPFIDQPTAAATGLGAMLLGANVVIAATTGNYFDAPAETNPLLNMWSLSVEEQFYLVFPALLAIGWLLFSRGAIRRTIPFLLVGGIAVLSFMLAIRGLDENPKTGIDGFLLGFYSPVTRAWEFAVGALLALALSRRIRMPSQAFMTLIALAGISLLFVSLWVITDSTPFPSAWTLLPVTGTLLLIFAGSRGTNAVSNFLSLSPMVRIGDWSYSIYLWHWPIIVFAVYLWPFAPYIAVIAALVSVIPALFSYYLVEQPLRGRIPSNRASLVRLMTLILLPPLLISGAVGVLAKFYWQPQFVSGERVPIHMGDTDWPSFYKYLGDTYYPCAESVIRENADKYEGLVRCSQSKPNAAVDIAIVGDSHAEHFFVGLAEALPEKNIAFYILAGTPPFDDNGRMSYIINYVAESSTIKDVIVSARWGLYDIPEDSLAATLSQFTSAGKTVFVTDDIPRYPFPAHRCQFGMSPLLPVVQCTQPRAVYDKTYTQYFPRLKAEVQNVPGVTLLTSLDFLCDADECSMTKNGQILYRDYDHLNNIGSRYFVDRFFEVNPDFRDAFTTY